uniref:phenylalanine--tRNA ligase n=1 Tax=Nemalion sp. H.1444 TaxID=1907586 RepID=A0A1G4NWJ0_9FLOR|nr:Phenylalanine-tRNA ligase beta subunit [Nemalion sp. H.1444]
MNISWKWLSELLDLSSITPEELSEQLTLSGFEIEHIQQSTNGDTILDISATSNRPDTVCMVGIAREISTLMRKPLYLSQTQTDLVIKRKNIPNINRIYRNCIYGAALGVNIRESPQWLKNRLSIYDIESQNNIIDIANLVLIKWGKQIKLIRLDKVNIDNITEYNLFNTSKEVRSDEILYHNDGITTSQINNKCNILIQTPIFKKDISIQEEESNNSTYGTNLENLNKSYFENYDILDAYSEATTLIRHLCQVEVTNVTYLSSTDIAYKPVHFSCDKAASLLGPISRNYNLSTEKKIEFQLYEDILDHLNFIIHRNFKSYYVNIPSYRSQDVRRQVDLTEEISRILGFDHFKDKIPSTDKKGDKNLSRYRVTQIRTALRNMGVNEVVHSSLSSQRDSTMDIYNPLTSEYSCLRNELMTGLIEANVSNLNQSNDLVNIFEIGRIFKEDCTIQVETTHVAGLISGSKNIRRQWNESPVYASWFQAKGDLEELFEKLNLQVKWKSSTADFYIYNNVNKYFHPKYISIIYINEEPMGVFGKLQLKFKSDSIINNMYGFELIIEKLQKIYTKDHRRIFQAYSQYPSIIRDINIEVSYAIPSNQVLKVLQTFSYDIIDSIQLFDVYDNHELKKGYKSMSFRIRYKKIDSTLTNNEVDIVESELKRKVYRELNSIR